MTNAAFGRIDGHKAVCFSTLAQHNNIAPEKDGDNAAAEKAAGDGE